MLNYSYLAQKNKQTNKQISKHNNTPKIFTNSTNSTTITTTISTILTIILSLILSCTTSPCFANTSAANSNSSSTNTSSFNNKTAIVATAAVGGALGVVAIIAGLCSGGSDNNNSSTPASSPSPSSTTPAPAPSPSDKAITAYSLAGTSATITGQAITVTVPYGTDITSLAATFTTTGASVKVGSTTQTSGTTTNDFTSQVIYTVTAADSTTATYTVNATVAPQTFTVTYNTNGGTGTVPTDSNNYASGTSVTVLSYSGLAVTGTSLKTPVFSSSYPCVSWNTAADGSGNSYTPDNKFDITENTTLYAQYFTTSMYGTSIGGGKLVSINNTPAAGSRQALIMADKDQSPGVVWINDYGQSTEIDANADGVIGTGITNTNTMIGTAGSGTCAASQCVAYSVIVDSVTYDDWYLPSRWELKEAFASGGLVGLYWSSTEFSAFLAWLQHGVGLQLNAAKGLTLSVRAVRAINY